MQTFQVLPPEQSKIPNTSEDCKRDSYNHYILTYFLASRWTPSKDDLGLEYLGHHGYRNKVILQAPVVRKKG